MSNAKVALPKKFREARTFRRRNFALRIIGIINENRVWVVYSENPV